ncbi:hypothetical protein BSKO_06564 [Bryopsis sp. KO-2023]|nr:hypothetical protein BSKO_06564 [Bryopsis sp. KO-2023]
MHGQGTYTFNDGISYEGEFFENTITGTGVYRWTNAVYEGEVEKGMRHGTGKLSLPGRRIEYNGEWWRGKRHGKGTLRFWFPDGSEMIFEGDWEDDRKRGRGQLKYCSGNVYDGEFVDDRKAGYGVMHWKDRGERYSGNWKNDKPNGLGVHVWLDNGNQKEKKENHHGVYIMYNRYEGMFRDGRRHGEGVLYYATGARYEGEWENDSKEGDGIFIFEDGSEFHGTFHNNKPVLMDQEKFGPKNNGSIHIHIDDVLREEQSPEKAGRGVNNVLMCHNTELRNLYEKYCQSAQANSKVSDRTSFTLLLSQFWELCRHARLPSTQMPLVRINQVIRKAMQPSPLVTRRREKVLNSVNANGVPNDSYSVHDPNNEILYTEFCESLVRIAQIRYLHLDKIEERVHALVNKDILPLLARKKSQNQEGTLQINQETQAYLASIDHVIRSLFFILAGVDLEDRGPESDWRIVYEYHITHRDVLKLFHDCELISDSLTSADVMRGCREACFAELRGPPDSTPNENSALNSSPQGVDLLCADTELTYPEFSDAIVLISKRAYEKKNRNAGSGNGIRSFLTRKNGFLTKISKLYGIVIPPAPALGGDGGATDANSVAPQTDVGE